MYNTIFFNEEKLDEEWEKSLNLVQDDLKIALDLPPGPEQSNAAYKAALDCPYGVRIPALEDILRQVNDPIICCAYARQIGARWAWLEDHHKRALTEGDLWFSYLEETTDENWCF